MVGLTVRLLGGFEARLASGELLDLPTKKAQALLAYLAARPGQAHPRDKLAALLWGGTPERQARDSLRHALAALRRALALTDGHPAPLRVDGQALALDPEVVAVDVVTFERRAAEGTPQALEEAAELYGGDLLLGFALSEPLFEDWLVAERERLRELALEALARLLAHQSRSAATERAIRTAVRLLALDPLQEAVHRALMQLYARQGRRGAALRQYQLCVDRLRRELGAEPELETRALYQELLRRPAETAGPVDALDVPGPRRVPPGRTPGAAALELPSAEAPLVGREADLARLRQHLEEAIRGRGHVVTVVGEAGIGKTRVVGALAAEALARGCRVLVGNCHESDSILPFAPWVDACRGGGLGGDEEVLGDLHPARRAELARLLPEAGRPGLPPAGDSPLPLFESVAALLEGVAARQPLLLVLEDMHWADEMSVRLLNFVGRCVPAWPALLIVTAREEELGDAARARHALDELARAPRATPIRLAPLSRADIARLVRALAAVGTEAAPGDLEEGIWAMSEGNPLVAVEAMLAFSAEHRGAGAPAGAGGLSLPERVRELIARRLDRLSARGQSLAAVAAVIGRRFDFALLRSAGRVDEHEAADAVEEMVRHHVLRTVGGQLEFTHERVRDVAYGRLVAPRRRLLHAAVVEALEAGSPPDADPAGAPPRDPPGERIEQLAYHAVRGGLGEKAVHYLRRAADRAAARSALRHARTALEEALGVLGTLPEDRSTWEQAFEVRLALRPVLVQLGELREALDLLREAEALAERLNDDARRGQVSAFMTNIHSRLDEPGAALVTGTRALEIAERRGDSRLRILATTYLEQAHYYRGEYARVIELATRNLAALPPEWVQDFFGGSQPPAVHDRFRLLVSLARLGRFAEAAEHEAEAIRLAEATQHPYAVAMAHYAAGTLHLLRGDWATGRARIERQISVLRAGNVVGELPTALALSAQALAYCGAAKVALARCREAEGLLKMQSARGGAGAGWLYYSLGRAQLVLGRLGEARRLANRAVGAASDRTDFLPDALQLVGDVASHPDGLDAAQGRVAYADALALAEERGMRPLVAHCHLGLGRLHRCTGEDEQAAEHLALARDLYREMAMPFWLAQATAAIAAPVRRSRRGKGRGNRWLGLPTCSPSRPSG
jgi:DNA-binding SARP family transcriptional activator